jgi:hypothetical protein
MLNENDLAIAKGDYVDPKRLSEIVFLQHPEIVLDLLFNPYLDSTQRFRVITQLLSSDINNVTLPDKFNFAHKAYKEFNYHPIHKQKIASMLKDFQDKQLHSIIIKLKNFESQLDSKGILDFEKYSSINQKITEINISRIISFGGMTNHGKDAFWTYFAALVYGYGESIRKEISTQTNRKVDEIVSEIFRFTSNHEIECEFHIGNESHPSIYINQLVLRARIKKSSSDYRLILEIARENARNFDELLEKARKINKERDEANRLKEIEREAKLLEEERLKRERNRLKEEQLADELMAYRAEGYSNAENEFSVYVTNLNRAQKSQISFDTLGNFLASNFTYSDLTVGFHSFINRCFTSIDHPVITFFAKDCEFSFQTSEDDFYTYRIVQGYYQAYTMTEEGPYSFNEDKKLIGTRTRKVITNYPYTDAWGLKNFFDDYWSKKGNKLKCAEFKRPGFDFDFLDMLAYLYSDPTIIETIPLYFSDWKFFADGLECDVCGRPLTHPISAVKGKGPVCGEHKYKLAMSDGERVEKYIRKYSKKRLLYRDSPLIKQRISWFMYQAPTREKILNLITSRRDLTSPEARSLIQSYISRRY